MFLEETQAENNLSAAPRAVLSVYAEAPSGPERGECECEAADGTLEGHSGVELPSA